MKLHEIFEMVGLDAEGIRAATAGASIPSLEVVATPESSEKQRPLCPACHRPIGTRTCVPIARARGNTHTLNAHPDVAPVVAPVADQTSPAPVVSVVPESGSL